jgi:hypothetical protein
VDAYPNLLWPRADVIYTKARSTVKPGTLKLLAASVFLHVDLFEIRGLDDGGRQRRGRGSVTRGK